MAIGKDRVGRIPIWLIEHFSGALSPRTRLRSAGNDYTARRVTRVADGSLVARHHFGTDWRTGGKEIPGSGPGLRARCRRSGKRPHFAASGPFAIRWIGQS